MNETEYEAVLERMSLMNKIYMIYQSKIDVLGLSKLTIKTVV